MVSKSTQVLLHFQRAGWNRLSARLGLSSYSGVEPIDLLQNVVWMADPPFTLGDPFVVLSLYFVDKWCGSAHSRRITSNFSPTFDKIPAGIQS